MPARRISSLALTAAATLIAGLSLVFFYAPVDADQGVIQKIFYIHVPMAIVALCGFIAAAGMAICHLRTGDRQWDVRAYVTIHLSIILAVGVLVTGAIWARGSWGHWWVWNEPALVSFLIVFLLYCTYQPLRFAIENPERQARYASGVCDHRRRLRAGELRRRPPGPGLHAPAGAGDDRRQHAGRDAPHVPGVPGGDRAAVRHAVGARADRQGGRSADAAAGRPLTVLAVALEAGDRYVAAAYVVFVALIVVYVAIMAAKLTRIQRALETLRDDRGEPER